MDSSHKDKYLVVRLSIYAVLYLFCAYIFATRRSVYVLVLRTYDTAPRETFWSKHCPYLKCISSSSSDDSSSSTRSYSRQQHVYVPMNTYDWFRYRNSYFLLLNIVIQRP